ncbi:MAG TPA: hypothetical protein ENK91_08335 [Bacteroidetes bacterium]|nr:hypothetical protein [Bacteroidota bacterium]
MELGKNFNITQTKRDAMKNTHLSVVLILRILFFAMISYGLLYFSYKYFSPNYGQSDFFHYYKMVLDPLNFSVTESPFIYRQLSTVITALVLETGLYYNIEIAYTQEGIDQHVFFAFILSNYLALLFTAFIVSRIVDLEIGKVTVLAPLLAGALCYLSFGASTYVLTGLVEGWSWFLIALALYAFKKENLVLFTIVLAVSVFQKEIVSMIFGVMSAVFVVLNYLRKDQVVKPKHVGFFLVSVFTFVTYILVRKVLIPVGGFENQLDLDQLIHYLVTYDFLDPRKLYITIFAQNLLYLALTLFVMNILMHRNEAGVKKYDFLKVNSIVALVSACVVLFLVGMAAALGSNIGRIVLATSPISAVYIGYFLYRLELKSRES